MLFDDKKDHMHRLDNQLHLYFHTKYMEIELQEHQIHHLRQNFHYHILFLLKEYILRENYDPPVVRTLHIM